MMELSVTSKKPFEPSRVPGSEFSGHITELQYLKLVKRLA